MKVIILHLFVCFHHSLFSAANTYSEKNSEKLINISFHRYPGVICRGRQRSRAVHILLSLHKNSRSSTSFHRCADKVFVTRDKLVKIIERSLGNDISATIRRQLVTSARLRE
jgi:hypothetical protein